MEVGFGLVDWRSRSSAVDTVETMGHRFANYAHGMTMEEFNRYVRTLSVVFGVFPPAPVDLGVVGGMGVEG